MDEALLSLACGFSELGKEPAKGLSLFDRRYKQLHIPYYLS